MLCLFSLGNFLKFFEIFSATISADTFGRKSAIRYLVFLSTCVNILFVLSAPIMVSPSQSPILALSLMIVGLSPSQRFLPYSLCFSRNTVPCRLLYLPFLHLKYFFNFLCLMIYP